MRITFCVCQQLMELARPSQNQLGRLVHSPLPFIFLFKQNPWDSLLRGFDFMHKPHAPHQALNTASSCFLTLLRHIEE